MTFADVLRGEIVKVRTLRPLVLIILATVVLGCLYVVIEAKPMGSLQELGVTTPDTAVVHAMANLSIFVAIVGVLIASSEYVGGQLTTSILAAPRRSHILAAKLLLSGLISTVLGLLQAVFVATIGQMWLGENSVYATGQAGTLLTSLAIGVVTWTALGIMSTCLALILRSQTTAMAGMVLISGPAAGGILLLFATTIGQYLPFNAAALMFINRQQQFSDYLHPPTLTPTGAATVLVLWTGAAIVAASVVFLRHDVGARQQIME